MRYIETYAVDNTVYIEIDENIAQKLQATLASIDDWTDEDHDLVRLMNHLSDAGVTAGVYHGHGGDLAIRVHPMFKEKS